MNFMIIYYVQKKVRGMTSSYGLVSSGNILLGYMPFFNNASNMQVNLPLYEVYITLFNIYIIVKFNKNSMEIKYAICSV